MNRNFLLASSLFLFLSLMSCNAQRNKGLCCGHKPDSAAIVLNNQAVNAYTYRSNYLNDQGNVTQALETLNAYLKRNPTEPYTLLGAGMFYEKMGNKKEAMDYYKRAEENFKRLYEEEHKSVHEINRYLAIKLIEGPKRIKALYEAERDRLASDEENRKANDTFVMSIIETPREEFIK